MESGGCLYISSSLLLFWYSVLEIVVECGIFSLGCFGCLVAFVVHTHIGRWDSSCLVECI